MNNDALRPLQPATMAGKLVLADAAQRGCLLHQVEQALHLQRVAFTGKHSRFDAVEFITTWEELVRNADSFPSTNTTVGLSQSFAWNQWGRLNAVVDAELHVRPDRWVLGDG